MEKKELKSKFLEKILHDKEFWSFLDYTADEYNGEILSYEGYSEDGMWVGEYSFEVLWSESGDVSTEWIKADMMFKYVTEYLDDYINQELDRAREEGRREILSLVEDLEETNLDGEEWWRICSAIEKTIIKLSNKK